MIEIVCEMNDKVSSEAKSAAQSLRALLTQVQSRHRVARAERNRRKRARRERRGK